MNNYKGTGLTYFDIPQYKPILDGRTYFDSPFQINITTPCIMESFWAEEMKKPMWLRSNSVLLSCPCPKCSTWC